MIRLGVNIDHIATLRNARGGVEPDPVQAAIFAELGGADNITCHLREDRRHINDRDLLLLKQTIKIPLNLEMAATEEMLSIALTTKPHSVTLVPEKRQERTTEGGLDLSQQNTQLSLIIQKLSNSGILVSLFVEPDTQIISTAKGLGAHAVEFHTGLFARKMFLATHSLEQRQILDQLKLACETAHKSGLQVHVGHGLNYLNSHWLKLIPQIEEANIGHAIMSRAIMIGLKEAVRDMKFCLNG